MMNLIQVQDDLKNFSQDQLVKEMQQPSGSTPQFLVLAELNRRRRVKGDMRQGKVKINLQLHKKPLPLLVFLKKE